MSSPESRIDRISFSELKIPFKVAFRHSSAERSETETIWIEMLTSGGLRGYGEGCPRAYVTAETMATARRFVERHEAVVRREIADIESLRAWIASHQIDIDANPAAWCAMELALLDAFGKHAGKTVEALLSMPDLSGDFCFTAVLGDLPPKAFHALAARYWQMGFRDFKVKLSGDIERDRQKLSVFESWPNGSMRVRADANNVWRSASDAIAGLRWLEFRFVALEEPIAKDQYSQLAEIGRVFSCPIILDESCIRGGQLSQLSPPPEQWIINVRISKMGGLIRSLDVIEAARDRGIGIVVGAQVGETSLLTRAALTAARAAGTSLVAQEGAFGTFLLERDVCDPPLMSGHGGALSVSAFPILTHPGLGIA
jgi:L-alanine-DL-glutamate epimerase-like enolase superfamily enzyme